MSSMPPAGAPEMSCDEVAELAGLYVLDALEPAERAAIIAHLATCPEAHEEITSLGGVVPALASIPEPLDAPPGLKARVMAAYEREGAAASAGTQARAPDSSPAQRRHVATPSPAITAVRSQPRRLPVWASWAAAIAAVLVVAVVGVWAVGVRSRADHASQRAQQLVAAVAVLSSPDASVAFVRGTGSSLGAADIRGFAAFPPAGPGYLVMVGLPNASAGKIYQAWYLVGGQPSSAGLLTEDEDGYAVLVGGQPPPGTNLVALTLEPAGGSDLPTSDPIAVGEVRAPS